MKPSKNMFACLADRSLEYSELSCISNRMEVGVELGMKQTIAAGLKTIILVIESVGLVR